MTDSSAGKPKSKKEVPTEPIDIQPTVLEGPDRTVIDSPTSESSPFAETVTVNRGARAPAPGTEAFSHIDIPGYQMLEKIGEGGMGIVFKAMQTSLQRTVAIKIVKAVKGAREAEYDEYVKRFRREALAGAKLNHPNIVSIYDHGVAGGIVYMVLEFVEGTTCQKAVRDAKRFAPKLALAILRDCVLGLSHACAKGIIHRDVKPANILLQSGGAVDARNSTRLVAKVADLGLSRFGDRATPELNDLTQAGTFLGSPDHMAPEQAEGKNVDFRADIYALGSTLYYMLTGRPPFRGETAYELIFNKSTTKAENPQDIAEGISDGVVHILDKMMAPRAEARYASYETLLEDLEAVIAGREPTSAPVPIEKSSIALPVGAGRISKTIAQKVVGSQKPAPSTKASGRGAKIGGIIFALAVAGTATFIALKGRSGKGKDPAEDAALAHVRAIGAADANSVIDTADEWKRLRAAAFAEADPKGVPAALEKLRAIYAADLQKSVERRIQAIREAQASGDWTAYKNLVTPLLHAAEVLEIPKPADLEAPARLLPLILERGTAERDALAEARAAKQKSDGDAIEAALADFETKYEFSPAQAEVKELRRFAAESRSTAKAAKAKSDAEALVDGIANLSGETYADDLVKKKAAFDLAAAALPDEAKNELTKKFLQQARLVLGARENDALAALAAAHKKHDYAALDALLNRRREAWRAIGGEEAVALKPYQLIAADALKDGRGEREKTEFAEAADPKTSPVRALELLDGFVARYPFTPEKDAIKAIVERAEAAAPPLTISVSPETAEVTIDGRVIAVTGGRKETHAVAMSAPQTVTVRAKGYYEARVPFRHDGKTPLVLKLIGKPLAEPRSAAPLAFDDVVNSPALKRFSTTPASSDFGKETIRKSVEFKCNSAAPAGTFATSTLAFSGMVNGEVIKDSAGWMITGSIKPLDGAGEVRVLRSAANQVFVLGVERDSVWFGIRDLSTNVLHLISPIEPRTGKADDYEYFRIEWHGDLLKASHGALVTKQTALGAAPVTDTANARTMDLAVRDGAVQFQEIMIAPSQKK